MIKSVTKRLRMTARLAAATMAAAKDADVSWSSWVTSVCQSALLAQDDPDHRDKVIEALERDGLIPRAVRRSR